jgi:hypothetical protein
MGAATRSITASRVAIVERVQCGAPKDPARSGKRPKYDKDTKQHFMNPWRMLGNTFVQRTSSERKMQ